MVSSQSLEGVYEHVEAGRTHQIQLLDSSKFVKSSWIFLGHGAHLEKGRYTRIGDTLLLKFEPYIRPKGIIKIIEKDTLTSKSWNQRDDKDYTWLTVQLYDLEEPSILSGPSLVDLVSEDLVIATVSTNNNGIFEYYSSKTIIDELIIRSMGFEEVKISLENFKGFRTNLDIILSTESPNIYREKEGEAKYILKDKANYLQPISKKGTTGPKYFRVQNRN